MDDEVREIDLRGELPEGDFKVCPECDYKDGFHSMFRTDGITRKWLFICPQCHAVFDIGLTV